MASTAGMTLLVAPGGKAGALKALFAAQLTKTAIAVSTVATGSIPLGENVALKSAAGVLAGANAVCHFLARSANALDSTSLKVDEWVEFEAAALAPAVATIAAGQSNDVTISALNTAFGRLEGALAAGGPYVTGAALTLADVVLYGSVDAVFTKNTIAGTEFPAVAAWHASFGGNGAAQAASKLANGLTFGAAGGVAPIAASGSIQLWLQQAFTAAIVAAFPQTAKMNMKAKVGPAGSANKFKHHYQCNSVMQVAARLKIKDRKIIAAFPSSDVVERLEAVKPGFINVYLAKPFLTARVQHVIQAGLLPPPIDAKKVVIDYSSPNIAKEMHVGHLRSTIIGDTIARILEFLGHTVERVNHVGDWGTQFGMLIAHLKDTMDTTGEMPSISDLTKFYKAAKQRFDDKTGEFNRRAHEETVKLQAGDEENTRLWKALCARSEEMFTAVYKRLGIDSRLKVCGESFYQQFLGTVFEQLEAKGMLEDSDGARVAFVRPRNKPPLMLRKSDGGVGYDTTDMACLWYRVHKLKADWLVYVVDAGQADHFENVFAGGKKAGWLDSVRIEHVKFGVVQGEDGKKFKTRSGETVRLVDLLDKARDLSKAELESRASSAEGSGTLVAAEDMDATAEALGYGGVKYFDLRQNRTNDYKFSYKHMLARNGDTAVYMQYAHARIASIARKAGVDPASLNPNLLNLEHQAEADLAFHITRFQEVVASIEDDLMPHHLCEYLWKLANQFSDFYNNCRVVGDAAQDSRLVLCHATALCFRKCMELLGINPIERL